MCELRFHYLNQSLCFNIKCIFGYQKSDLTDLKLTFLFSITFFFAKAHFDLILSHGLEEFSNGCPDMYNAAGEL